MCTLVQAQSIPAVLGGRDHVVKAKTGTGKTLAFLIPAIERVSHATLAQSAAAAQRAEAGNGTLHIHSRTVVWQGHRGSSACVNRPCAEFWRSNPRQSGREQKSLSSNQTAASCSVCFVLLLQMQKLGVPQGSLAVLILSPTRELAMQIATEAEQVGHFQRLSVQVMSCVQCIVQP